MIIIKPCVTLQYAQVGKCTVYLSSLLLLCGNTSMKIKSALSLNRLFWQWINISDIITPSITDNI